MNDTPVEATANPAPIVLDLNPPGTPAQARALIDEFREHHQAGATILVTRAAAVVLCASTKKSIEGKTSRGTLRTSKHPETGKLLIPVEDLVADGILDPERPGERTRGAARGDVIDFNPYPAAAPVAVAAVDAAGPPQDVAVATVTVDLNQHMTHLREWFEESAGERETLLARTAAAEAEARAARERAEAEAQGRETERERAERLAAEMLTLAAKSERERAEREAAVRQVEATAEEMEALRAEVTTLREQVAAAGSRRRGIFGS